MKKILLLGSGELGKEFVIAAMRAGQYVIACDRYDNAPAMQVADEREVFSMLDGDALEAVVNNQEYVAECYEEPQITVCGEDGITYYNRCFMEKAGVKEETELAEVVD